MKKLILLSLISLSSLKAIEVKPEDWESTLLEGYETFNSIPQEEKLEYEYRAKVYENLLLRCQRALEEKLDSKIAGDSKESFYCKIITMYVAFFAEEEELAAAIAESKQ
jgi:hypothetical protein